MAPPIPLVDLTLNTSTRITMRYREPYVTEGINKKLAVTLPYGVYRGWRLGASVANLSVTVEPDPQYNDHVLSTRSVVGDALTIRLEGGLITLDLSALSLLSQTVVIGVFAYYSLAATTTAEIRAYLEADWNALSATDQSEVTVLGTVVVPAGGVISASAITHDHRSESWGNVASAAVPWASLVKNGSFEWGPPGASGQNRWPPWENTLVPNGSWTVETVDPEASSGVQHLQLASTSAGAALTGTVFQKLDVPVHKAQHVRLSFRVKAVQAATGGTFTVTVRFRDIAGVAIEPPSCVLTVPVTSVDVNYRTFDKTILIPAGLGVSQVGEVRIDANALVFALNQPAIRIDNFQLHMETRDALSAHPEHSGKGTVVTSGVVLTDPASGATANSVLISVDPVGGTTGAGEVIVGRPDGNLAANQPAFLTRGPFVAGGGGSSSETGVHGIGSLPDGIGVWGEGKGVGQGGRFDAGAYALAGFAGEGSRSTGGKNSVGTGGIGAAAYGGFGVGGTGGAGVFGQAGGPNGVGFEGAGIGTGAGIHALGGLTSPSSYATRSYGAGGTFDGGGLNSSGVTGQGGSSAGKIGSSTLSFLNSGVLGVGSGAGSGVVGVSAAATGAIGVNGIGSSGGNTDGVHGTAGSFGSGVVGLGALGVQGTTTSFFGSGVLGVTAQPASNGVTGENDDTSGGGGAAIRAYATGTSVGIDVTTLGTAGYGDGVVIGVGDARAVVATNASGAPGAYFQNSGDGGGFGAGIMGVARGTSPIAFSNQIGVVGIANAGVAPVATNIGVFGGGAVGVHGQGDSLTPLGIGVWGVGNILGFGGLFEGGSIGMGLMATAGTSGAAAGGDFTGGGTGGNGVTAKATVGGAGHGVSGTALGTGNGVVATAVSGNGVVGLTGGATVGFVANVGVYGKSPDTGVRGDGGSGGSGVYGENTTAGSTGVYGRVTQSNSIAIYAEAAGGGTGLQAVSSGTTNSAAEFQNSGGPILKVKGFSPAVTDGFKNTLNNFNICKAWALIAFDSSSIPHISAGFNVASISVASTTPGLWVLNYTTPVGYPEKGVAVGGGALAAGGGLVTITAPTNSGSNVFTATDVGRFIFLTGAITASNNSSPFGGGCNGWAFLITAVIGPTQAVFHNLNGVTEAFTGTWLIHNTPVAVNMTVGNERQGVGAPNPAGAYPRPVLTRQGYVSWQLTDSAGVPYNATSLQSYTVSIQVMAPQY